MALARLQSSDSKAGGMANINLKEEAQKAKEKLTATPDIVSTTSSTHPIMGEVGTKEEEDHTDMMAGIRADMVRWLRRSTKPCVSWLLTVSRM